MARRIEKVEHVAVELERHDRGRDRDAPVALDLHPVRPRPPRLPARRDLASRPDGAAGQQQVLGQRRLAGVRVGDNGKGAPPGGFSHVRHGSGSLSAAGPNRFGTWIEGAGCRGGRYGARQISGISNPAQRSAHVPRPLRCIELHPVAALRDAAPADRPAPAGRQCRRTHPARIRSPHNTVRSSPAQTRSRRDRPSPAPTDRAPLKARYVPAGRRSG